ncbi:glycosyltransferase family 4 protein [Haloarchaeobius amylolyticus]|uniref:glycosyltransferase family 4 protein n=1 Tax=Haloarchaeobius amylolyticus TaxID=1198296 RepID=UPI00226E41B5|nr:glycosyltransferase family 4 protein [Haloarchaeobius amylolyticus]
MKVLQLITSTRTFFETQVETLEDRGVECTTLAVPGTYAPDEPRSVSDYLKYAPKVLRESIDDYDVVHANYGLVGPFALAQPRRPVVVTFWGTDLMSDMTWLRSLSRQSARLADEVVLPSKAMAPEVPTDYAHVPFGVDTEQFRPIPREEAKERVGWPQDETVALFPYETTRPEKDFDRARRLVEQADADVTLRPVSGVDYAEMPYYMNASDLLLLTSTRESGPMTVKEAAACNLPVVSTDVGFVRDVVGDVAHCHVSDADPDLVRGIEQVAAPDVRSDGRWSDELVSHDEMADRLLSVYDAALA